MYDQLEEELMAYQPNVWKDRLGVGLNIFKDQNEKVYEFVPAPTSVTQVGTPFSADWMNHLEQGVAAAQRQVTFGTNEPSGGESGDVYIQIL